MSDPLLTALARALSFPALVVALSLLSLDIQSRATNLYASTFCGIPSLLMGIAFIDRRNHGKAK